jgi:hypothetical protein
MFERLICILIFSPSFRSRGENRMMKTRSFRSSQNASTNCTFHNECERQRWKRRENDESAPLNRLFEVKKGDGQKISGATSKTPFSCDVALTYSNMTSYINYPNHVKIRTIILVNRNHDLSKLRMKLCIKIYNLHSRFIKHRNVN